MRKFLAIAVALLHTHIATAQVHSNPVKTLTESKIITSEKSQTIVILEYFSDGSMVAKSCDKTTQVCEIMGNKEGYKKPDIEKRIEELAKDQKTSRWLTIGLPVGVAFLSFVAGGWYGLHWKYVPTYGSDREGQAVRWSYQVVNGIKYGVGSAAVAGGLTYAATNGIFSSAFADSSTVELKNISMNQFIDEINTLLMSMK